MSLSSQKADISLLEAGQKGISKIYAVFGGQGPNNRNCFDDLLSVYDANRSILAELVDLAASTINKLSTSRETEDFYEESGFELKKWLTNPRLAPEKAFLATAPYSFPIITLISLANYMVACKKLGILPKELRNSLDGATGHSQGIIAAAAIAKSNGWQDFYDCARTALTISFWIGFESHLATPGSSLPAAAVRESESHGEGYPSPMLGVNGLDPEHLHRLVLETNSRYPLEQHIYLALVNSREKAVISGPPDTLRTLSLRLRKVGAKEGLDQRRVPFIHRKPVVGQQYLPISGAFHSSHLESAATRVLRMLDAESWTGDELGIALYHTGTGENLQRAGSKSIVKTLVRAIMLDMVDWRQVCSQMRATHLLDFGPGQTSSLSKEIMEGLGLQVIKMFSKADGRSDSGVDLLKRPMSPHGSSWGDLYAPRLVQAADGSSQIATKMTRIFGAPPVMVSGMTPTTVPWDFVSAVMRSGYHVELAGGGYSKSKDFEDAIKLLHATLPVGRGITCNLIYVNPRQISWQIPLLRRLNRDGIHIDGLTIGAGIPSAEVVQEYVETLGLKHISFKPGSYEAMLEVIEIAQQHPKFPIGLQWTGGRAGGHHSFDDFHTPLLKAYNQIRQCDNIILIAGSGFGGAEDTLPYLTGEWARSLGYPLMPIDGVLMGSRLMVAKEAHTSPQVKSLIVQAEGLDDSEWYRTYEESAGGFITINSEMGQPIHMLATRGTMLWRELEARIFSIKDPAERLQHLHQNRADIIQRLNCDYAKPWFAVKTTGECVDLEDMTYLEVLRRLINLMYVGHQQRWIDASYHSLVEEYLRRCQERLSNNGEVDRTSHDPYKTLTSFTHVYPLADSELLHPEDVLFLLALFKRRGQKPVNFIPILDEDFETFFKKDSLWQAEDLEAVPDRDVQRICVIHGPVAARHSKAVDEPAGKILDDINRGYIDSLRLTCKVEKLLDKVDAKRGSSIPKPVIPLTNVHVEVLATQKTYRLAHAGDLPEMPKLIDHILEGRRGWLHACLIDENICRGGRTLPNPIRSAFRPTHGDVVVVKHDEANQIQEIALIRRSPTNFSSVGESLKLASCDGGKVTVKKSVPNPVSSVAATINFDFEFADGASRYRLFEQDYQRNEKIKHFYAELWDIEFTDALKVAGLTSEFPGKIVTISHDVVADFMHTISKSDITPSARWTPKKHVPIDICVFVAWSALVTPLLISAVDIDLLKLLHRSNSFEYYPGVRPLEIGDTLASSSRIDAVAIQPTGKLIEVVAVITRDSEAVVKVTSVFFIQGQFNDYQKTFKSTQEPEMIVSVASEVTEALLRSRKWLIFHESAVSSLMGMKLTFKTTTHRTFKQGSEVDELKVDGQIYSHEGKSGSQHIGRVYFETENSNGNPVSDFLSRHAIPRSQRQLLESPGPNEEVVSMIKIPRGSAAYSKLSRDTNPIHVCPIFAGYCHLPGTVTHGMYTSAAVRRAVEMGVGDRECLRFRQYSASFEGMVLPGDTLSVKWTHIAMVDGRMVLSIQAFKDKTNEKVLEAEAEIEQASTAYLFCGQGSQEKGMGMSLYESSTAARAIWDRGDQYLRDVYGFSILHLVRDDPKALTVYFGGKRGRKIRENYMAMSQRTAKSSTGGAEQPILKGLSSQTTSYTFSEERGLLFSTQFSQPAIALMEMAEFEHLKAQGVVQNDAKFAGHSLGEYAALGSCTTFLSLENLVDLIFYRGLRMQNAVQRDEDGRTEYSMVAANPSRVGQSFGQDSLESVIQIIRSEAHLLLEVVNHNVKRQQYVCAGNLRALWTLGKVLDTLSAHPRPGSASSEEIVDIVREKLAASSIFDYTVELQRGIATIPLKGIDIPFHSTLLRGEIDNYRQFLRAKLTKDSIEPEQMVDRFIPNVMGKPFSITKSYIEQVADVTGSKQLRHLLQGMA